MFSDFDLSKIHPVLQLLLLFFLVVVGMLLSLFLVMIIGMAFWGMDAISMMTPSSGEMSSTEINFLKLNQMVVQIGGMLVPPIIFSFFYKKQFSILKINKINPVWVILIAVLLPLIFLPGVGLLGTWNSMLAFPEKFEWLEDIIRNMEKAAEELTLILLQANNIWALLFNLIVIAVVPAISEEFLFRGIVQNVFKQWFKNNIHWAVFVTAIIFSALHGQFFGFLPRFALGMMLGYLFVYTGSIWAPIIAHFVNNATAVVVAYFYSIGATETSFENFGNMAQNTSLEVIFGLVSFAVTAVIIFLLYKKQKELAIKTVEM